PALNDFISALFTKPMTDSVSCPAGTHKAQPILGWSSTLVLVRKDFNRVTMIEHCIERNQAIINPGTHGAVTNLGVHTVGKIHGGRTGWESFDLSLGGEYVDFC